MSVPRSLRIPFRLGIQGLQRRAAQRHWCSAKPVNPNERIDPVAKRVVAGDREFAGDALVVSLGATFAPESVPGLSTAGHNFFTLGGAASL